MTTVADVSGWMERFAPLSLAESWDNVGLLWGDPKSPVSRIMTCLTVTPETAEEAIEERAELIVSHHPVLFRPVQKVTADRLETGFLWALGRAGVSIYSPHTAFDNTVGGINDGLAKRLGLLDVESLRPSSTRPRFKVVVFVPAADREAVLSACFAAGAGRIGDYEECSFTTGGYGTFFGTESSSPTVGQAGRRERVREWKTEFVVPGDRLEGVLAALRASHSYEEPAIDLIPLREEPIGPGIGRLGRLAEKTTLDAFANDAVRALGCGPVQVVGEPSREIGLVAIACGAGDDFLKDAGAKGADVLLTGEARFHRALESRGLGVCLVVAGHFATERPGVEDLATRLAGAFPSALVWPSRRESDPVRSLA
ncbi:MAG: dinuclear metal center protein YbgI/SA1388 family [Planctomycetota bacterium]|nr:dinuclear metal center protein YbgI/SA1388 family [Planctomycetota bacterium]